jgi:hypothetical protein
MDTLYLIAAVNIVCCVAAFLIAQSRRLADPLTYAVAGLLVGPIGVLLALVIGGPQPTASSMPNGSRDEAVASLSQLADLRARGVLTEQEYQAKKTGIVSGL